MIVNGIPFVQGRNDYTDGDNKKYGMAIHNTSNDASDEAEADYATRRTDGISSHFYLDGDSITQSIDTVDKCGHAGSSTGNENAIAFEFTGANGKSRQWWIDNIDWDGFGYVVNQLILYDPNYANFEIRRASVSEMKTNPKVRAFYGHDDMRLAWGGTTHTDPGPNFPWDVLITSVKHYQNGDDMSAADVWNHELVNPATGSKMKASDRLIDAETLAGQAKSEALAAKTAAEAALAATQALAQSISEGITVAAEVALNVQGVDQVETAVRGIINSTQLVVDNLGEE